MITMASSFYRGYLPTSFKSRIIAIRLSQNAYALDLYQAVADNHQFNSILKELFELYKAKNPLNSSATLLIITNL